MTTDTPLRPLSSTERSVVARILNDYSGPGAAGLLGQLDSGVMVRGPVTMLELEVPGAVAPAATPDGPIGIRAIVESPEGEVLGELIIWVQRGFLSGLEYAWYSDDPPDALPDPTRIRTSGL